MEHTRYQHKHLELCRDCAGEGFIYSYHIDDVLQMNPLGPYICTTCQGHGRVWVSKKIVTTVVPFKNNTITL